MTPEVILRELGQIAIGDIQLETTDGQDSWPSAGSPGPRPSRHEFWRPWA